MTYRRESISGGLQYRNQIYMTFVNIASRLYTIIQNVKNAPWSKLSGVFSYDPSYTDEAGFPYASIINRGATESLGDQCENITLYAFSIRVCDVVNDKTLTENTLRSLCDDILAELRREVNLDLSGTVEKIYPLQVSWGWDNTSQNPLRFFEISMDVKNRNPIHLQT
jgi:hypothetical protein